MSEKLQQGLAENANAGEYLQLESREMRRRGINIGWV
jgi:hypothetical protein